MLNCQEVNEMASDFLDDRLSWWERFQMRLHFAMCLHCQRFLQQFQGTVSLMKHMGAPEVSQTEAGDVARKILQQERTTPSQTR